MWLRSPTILSQRTSLFYAIQNLSPDDICTLIDASTNVNITDDKGKSPLFYAVENDDQSVVRALIKAYGDLNVTNKDGKTALIYAVRNDNETMVKALIDAGADVSVTDKYGETALFHAVRNGKETAVKTLIDAGADVNVTNENGVTVLFYAVYPDNVILVKTLINAGADVNATDKDGRTPLFYAMIKSLETARLLLDKGGNLNVRDRCYVSILLFFIENCFKRASVIAEGLNLFKEKGVIENAIFSTLINVVFCSCFRVRVNSSFGELRLQSLLDILEIAKRYIKEDDQKQIIIQNILTTMKSEAFPDTKRLYENGVSKILAPLVELGANPNFADTDGNTALHHATRLSFEEVSQETLMDICLKLKELGACASFNTKNHQNQNPLLFGLSEVKKIYNIKSEGKLTSVYGFLIENGSSLDDIEKGGNSVFHLILLLLKQILEFRPTDKERKTILLEVMKLFQLFCRQDSVKRVTINRRDANLNSPLHLWASLEWIRFTRYNVYADYDDYEVRVDYDDSGDYDDHGDYYGGIDYDCDYDFYGANDDVERNFKDCCILKAILTELLTCGAKLNDINENDETPLHLCTSWSAVNLLLEEGANPNLVDSSRRTPLLSAARRFKDRTKYRNQNLEAFYEDVSEKPDTFWKTAFERNLDPWITDKEGESVLSLLIESEAIALAKSLLEVASKIKYLQEAKVATSLLNIICTDRSTSAQWKSILVEIILKSRKGGSISLQSNGETPLHCCCRNIIEFDKHLLNKKESSGGLKSSIEESIVDEIRSTVHWTIAKQLLRYGADCKIQDAKGQSCLDIAEECAALKDLLLKPVDINEVPLMIPWNSVSKTHKHILDKVARGQEVNHVEPFWYHQNHLQSGSFGLVFAGINEKDGREVAIKRIEKARMLRPEDKREITNLTVLADCEQAVRYFSFFEDDHFSYVVLELMEGNLDEYLDGIFSAQESVNLCENVVKGLNFLHSSNILHRDLKPSNILFKSHPKLCLKIADFGLSRRIDSTSTTVYGTNAGTRCWIAPELLKFTKDHTKESDIFSCGLVLHYILSRKRHPFSPADCAHKSPFEISNKTEANVISSKMEGWDNSLSPEATDLVKKMLDSDESKRPGVGETMLYPFFWSKKKKLDLLTAVGNQPEFECPRAKRSTPLTAVETDLETKFTTIVKYANWNDPGYVHMPAIYTEMTKKRKSYDTHSVVELVRLIRNAIAHVSEGTRPTPIRKQLLEDFVFLEYFPNLVIEVFKAVTTHRGWDKREEIKYAMNK